MTGSNKRPNAIGRSQSAPIVEPTPRELIRAIQQIGHFGIKTVSRAGTADVPIEPERPPRDRMESSLFNSPPAEDWD